MISKLGSRYFKIILVEKPTGGKNLLCDFVTRKYTRYEKVII